jgi:hypothetical protein
MVFCFALVFVQQHQANIRAAAAKQAYNTSHATLSPSSLKALVPLQPIAVTAPPGAGTAANSASAKLSAPSQPSTSSGSAVQSAAPASQPVDSIIYEVAKPVTGTLDNLLH